jgi:hypothetical protein
MIPATSPRTVAISATYDQWVPVALSGYRPAAGQFSMSVRLHRCRVLDTGATELSPDESDFVIVTVPDINAGASADYPQAVRDQVQQAAAAIVAAAAAVGASRGVI